MIAPSQTGQTPMITPTQANQLTSYLYGLKTPEAVQQYAMQHQNDINVVGLASSVANAMKRAQGAQPPQQPQGTVAQQAVAGMAQPAQPQQPMQPPPQMMPQQAAPQAAQQLPENTGIAQLPAQNVQKMAGGGITGEPQGRMEGGTRRFDVAGQVPSTLDVIQQGNTAALQPLIQQFQQAQSQWMATLNSGDQQAINRAFQQKEALRLQLQQQTQNQLGGPQAYASALNTPPPKITLAPAPVPAPTTYSRSDPRYTSTGALTPAGTAFNASYTPINGGIAAAPNMAKTPVIPAAPATPAVDPNAQMAAATSSVFGPGTDGSEKYGLDQLSATMQKLGIAPMTLEQNMEFARKNLPLDDLKSHLDMTKNAEDIKAAYAKAGVDVENSKAFKQLDDLSQKNEALLDKKSNLALMAAGFTMMSTPGSAFTAIGKGGEQGLGIYANALDKYQDGAQKIAEGRIGLEKSKNEMAAGIAGKGVDLAHQSMRDIFAGNKAQLDAGIAMLNTDKQNTTHMGATLLNAQVQTENAALQARTSLATTGMNVGAQDRATQAHKDVGMAQVGVSQGQLALAQQLAPSEMGLRAAQASYYNQRPDMLSNRLDAAAHTAALRSADTAMKAAMLQDPMLKPGTPRYDMMYQSLYQTHYAAAAGKAPAQAGPKVLNYNQTSGNLE